MKTIYSVWSDLKGRLVNTWYLKFTYRKHKSTEKRSISFPISKAFSFKAAYYGGLFLLSIICLPLLLSTPHISMKVNFMQIIYWSKNYKLLQMCTRTRARLPVSNTSTLTQYFRIAPLPAVLSHIAARTEANCLLLLMQLNQCLWF